MLNPIEEVRLLIGDKNPNFQILSDDEIQYFLSKYNSVNRASLAAATSVLFTITSLPTKEICGDIEVSNDWLNGYRRALELFIKNPNLNLINFQPYAGGISKSDMRNNDLNSDNVRPNIYSDFASGERKYNKAYNCTEDDSEYYLGY